MDAIEKAVKQLELITYLNQYKEQGIEIVSFEESRHFTSETGYYRAYNENRETTIGELAKKFCLKRWEEREAINSLKDFLNEEINLIESFPEELVDNYEYQIKPIRKYFKEWSVESKEEVSSKEGIEQTTMITYEHQNIFINNAFDVWIEMFEKFQIKQDSRTDVKFMFEIMKRDNMIYKSVSQVSYLMWIEENFNLDISKTANIDLKNNMRLAIYNSAKKKFISKNK